MTGRDGFTLIELLVAVAIFTTLAAALAQTLVSAQQARASSARWSRATQLAEERLERLRAGDRVDDGGAIGEFSPLAAEPAEGQAGLSASPSRSSGGPRSAAFHAVGAGTQAMSHRSPGFSLVELLVGMAFLSLFGLAVHQCCRAAARRTRPGSGERGAGSRPARRAAHVADAREAGFRPSGPLPMAFDAPARTFSPSRAISTATATSMMPTSASASQYAADRHAMLRQLGDAPPQPLLGDLDDDGLVHLSGIRRRATAFRRR
jgi:prepilin-type N-terminal cleavage/methylation domain-containing protein